jgi:hypothetical protein
VLELSHASVDINIGTGGQPRASAEAGSVIIRSPQAATSS